MSIKSRTHKINQVANDPQTQEAHRYSKGHRVYLTQTPWGDEQRVTVNWLTRSSVRVTLEDVTHPANHNGTICYQALGVLKRAARDAGKTLAFCETLKDAKRLSNLGGEIIEVCNIQGPRVWAVMKTQPLEERVFWFNIESVGGSAHVARKDNRVEFRDRVNLMRGPVEEGIE